MQLLRRRRWYALAIAVVVALGITLAVVRFGGGQDTAVAGPVDGSSAPWNEDFTGPAGSAPDPARWGHDVGGTGWGNNEREYYTADTANAALDGDGHLVITARAGDPDGHSCWYGPCAYTSARLTTNRKLSQLYGHVEASIKVPTGKGVWPAFWAVGDNIGRVGWPQSGEIDIMEMIGSEPGTNNGSLHGPGYALTDTYEQPGGQSFADGFHTYAIDWSPGTVTFSVDGTPYETRTRADAKGHQWVFDHPFYLILNVAVGGTWPGSPDAGTSFPQQMVVDYVHVSG